MIGRAHSLRMSDGDGGTEDARLAVALYSLALRIKSRVRRRQQRCSSTPAHHCSLCALTTVRACFACVVAVCAVLLRHSHL